MREAMLCRVKLQAVTKVVHLASGRLAYQSFGGSNNNIIEGHGPTVLADALLTDL